MNFEYLILQDAEEQLEVGKEGMPPLFVANPSTNELMRAIPGDNALWESRKERGMPTFPTSNYS